MSHTKVQYARAKEGAPTREIRHALDSCSSIFITSEETNEQTKLRMQYTRLLRAKKTMVLHTH